MRFLMMVKTDDKYEAGVLPDEKLLSEMGSFNDELVKAGVLLAAEGLQPSSKGARVKVSGKTSRVIDGPFAEAKELLGGYWMIEAKSTQEAIEWAKRVPFEEGEVELRQVFELEDISVDPAERKPGTARYLALLKADQNTEAGMPPNEKLLSEMGALIAEMASAGALLAGDGLQPSSKGARVRYDGKRRRVIDGPFAESKELIAGITLLQANSREEAIEWARRCLQIHVDGTGIGQGEIEVRQVSELEDFPVDPAEKADGWRQKEQRFRDRQP